MQAQETLMIFRRHYRIFSTTNFVFFFWVFQNWEKDQVDEASVYNKPWQILAVSSSLCKAAVEETHFWHTLPEKNQVWI